MQFQFPQGVTPHLLERGAEFAERSDLASTSPASMSARSCSETAPNVTSGMAA
jgi:hypothetical protein